MPALPMRHLGMEMNTTKEGAFGSGLPETG